MANYIAPEYNSLYIPLDYSSLPAKEYIPPIPDFSAGPQCESVPSETPKPMVIARRNTKQLAAVSETTSMSQQNDAFLELEAKWGDVIKGIGGGWTAVPNLLLRKQGELNISSSELNALINLIRFWWLSGKAPFPSPEKMATEMGVTPRTVYRNLASLEEKGFLDRVAVEGKATRYKLHSLVEKLKEVKNTA